VVRRPGPGGTTRPAGVVSRKVSPCAVADLLPALLPSRLAAALAAALDGVAEALLTPPPLANGGVHGIALRNSELPTESLPREVGCVEWPSRFIHDRGTS
jgi:hypothetical protein